MYKTWTRPPGTSILFRPEHHSQSDGSHRSTIVRAAGPRGSLVVSPNRAHPAWEVQPVTAT